MKERLTEEEQELLDEKLLFDSWTDEAEEEMDSKMSHAYFDAIEHIDVIDDGENHPHLIFSNKKNSKRKDEKEHHDVRVRIT